MIVQKCVYCYYYCYYY